MSKNSLRPPVKTHGGKSYLKWWLIEHFPKDYQSMDYCEPFCGGANVFLNKERSRKEVINDIDPAMIGVLKSLRDEPKEFITKIKRTRYTERVFKSALLKNQNNVFEDYFDRGINEYILRRMSRGGLKTAFAWSERQRGGKPGDVNAWETMFKELPLISDRLQNSIILCKSFVEIIKVWDEDDIFFYIDPPYLHSTRTEGSTKAYNYELSVDDHMNLLHLAKNARGKVMISGYPSPLYNRTLKNWRCIKKEIANHSGQGESKERRIEAIWMNYDNKS